MRPVMFLTAQKSADSSRTINTKEVMKLSMKGVKKMYTMIAENRKAMWKSVTYGCLQEREENYESPPLGSSAKEFSPQLVWSAFIVELFAEVLE
jgi:hypothetical protein